MNAINSLGLNLLGGATPAQKAAVQAEANALQAAHNASTGKIG